MERNAIRPVFEKNLDEGIIAEANRDGTTFVNKNVSAAKKKAAIAHENVHHDQMLQNKLDYNALVANFESGDTLKKLQAELQKSKDSAQESIAFTRKAMMEANFQPR